MKVLMISGDPMVLDINTEAGKRTEEYRQVLGDLDILVCRNNILSFIDKFLMAQGMMWQKKYDVITAQDVEHSFLAWLLSRLHNTPWQMQIHTDIFNQHFVKHSLLNKIRVSLAKFLIPRADCVRVVSERIRNSLISNFKFPISNIIVLPIFVDIDKFKNTPIKTDLHKKYGHDKFIILMASRITKEKNIGLAIEAVKAAKAQILQDLAQSRKRDEQSNPATAGYACLEKFSAETLLLLIVGDGPELNNLKFQVSSSKIQDFVKFEPRTDDLSSYYKTCDLFLLTSNYEGYGMTLVEAFAAGAKIISSDVGISCEILGHEAVFKVGDKEDLWRKLALAFEKKWSAPNSFLLPTKERYLELYRDSLKICLKQQKKSE